MLLQVFQGHDNHVRSIAFGSGGTILFSGARDETVRMWNIADGRPLLVLRMPHMVNAITMAGNNLFCGFVDGRVRVVLVKEVQALLTTFKSENKSVFEAKKKEVACPLRSLAPSLDPCSSCPTFPFRIALFPVAHPPVPYSPTGQGCAYP